MPCTYDVIEKFTTNRRPPTWDCRSLQTRQQSSFHNGPNVPSLRISAVELDRCFLRGREVRQLHANVIQHKSAITYMEEIASHHWLL